MSERQEYDEARGIGIGGEERTDPRFRERLGDRLDALVPETVKRLALAGMGAVFMTEEGIRNAVADLKLPREVVSTMLANTEKARAELFRLIAVELRRFLEEANIAGELRKVLIGLSMDVNASISFRASEDGRLVTRAEVASKRSGRSRQGKTKSKSSRGSQASGSSRAGGAGKAGKVGT
ncbi:MAG: hypothetical protein ACOC0J_01030 [Myxococcota bacterium]